VVSETDPKIRISPFNVYTVFTEIFSIHQLPRNSNLFCLMRLTSSLMTLGTPAELRQVILGLFPRWATQNSIKASINCVLE